MCTFLPIQFAMSCELTLDRNVTNLDEMSEWTVCPHILRTAPLIWLHWQWCRTELFLKLLKLSSWWVSDVFKSADVVVGGRSGRNFIPGISQSSADLLEPASTSQTASLAHCAINRRGEYFAHRHWEKNAPNKQLVQSRCYRRVILVELYLFLPLPVCSKKRTAILLLQEEQQQFLEAIESTSPRRDLRVTFALPLARLPTPPPPLFHISGGFLSSDRISEVNLLLLKAFETWVCACLCVSPWYCGQIHKEWSSVVNCGVFKS